MTNTTATSAAVTTTSYGAGIYTINNFLSPQECADFIARSEQIGFSEAVIRTDDGDRLMKEARNNDRILYDNAELGATLFQRALPWLPPEIDGWKPCGMNERFRFYRYTSAQFFKWHQDGTFRRSAQEESFLTFILYLNDDYAGGATEFAWEKIQPRAGTALVFPHRLRHQGAAIVSGTKYVLRTDVMYGGLITPGTSRTAQ
jgi:predicted 2-oxoglutarate/Fe(II)-dependent dioxygenase YbiX